MEITINVAAPELAAAINNLANAFVNKPTLVITDILAATKPEKSIKKVENISTEKSTIPAKTEEKVQVDKPQENDPISEPEPEKPEEITSYTLVQVREKLAALSQAGKQVQVKALITKTGATKLSEIPPEKYSELMKEAEAL